MRLIDADVLLSIYDRDSLNQMGRSYARGCLDIIGDIEDAPTIDAVPVIRCKNCKRCDGFSSADIQPNEIGICKINMMGVKPTDFCSYGERKE